MSRAAEQIPAADVDGLFARPCDPLILAVRLDGRPLSGLTARVDWRLGGALSALVRAGEMPDDHPLLRPAPALLPVPRMLLWRVGAATPREMARRVGDLRGERPGLCAADFDFSAEEVRAAFGARVVLYGE